MRFRRRAGVEADQCLAPGDPSRSKRGRNFLIVNPGAVRFQRAVALLEHGQLKATADQRLPRLPGKLAKSVIDERNDAFGVAQHDQIALRLEQAAGALLGFLQFPIAIGQRLVVECDLAKFLAQKAQPHAQRGEPDAGERKQKTCADREIVGVIAGILGSAANDETVGTAKGGGKNHEGTDGGDDPGVAPRKAA